MKRILKFIMSGAAVTVLIIISIASLYNGKVSAVDNSYNPFPQWRKLDGNNISAFFTETGVFDQDFRTTNTPGLEWPKGSNKFAVFTAGLSISAIANGKLAQTMSSYKGEFITGYCQYGQYRTDNRFKIYLVSRNDNPQNNPDWANWGMMVPFGAPFTDANNNGIYEPFIDTPGVKNAQQTLFVCITDANPSSHNLGEGFGGGVLPPLGSEVHLTAWCYNTSFLNDAQFIKWVIVNKSPNTWNKFHISIVSDPDIGYSGNDYIGCDTIRNLGFCYNASNNDPIYGLNPPAMGFRILKGSEDKSLIPSIKYGMTSFVRFIGPGSAPPPCEADPNGQPYPAYLFLKGFKKDSTCWMDVSSTPPKKTKFVYSGDPETDAGWTAYKGFMANCQRDTTAVIYPVTAPHDMRFCCNSGTENITVAPGDSQVFIVSQMVARGTDNKNSVTKLKSLSDSVYQYYNTYIRDTLTAINPVPETFTLYQNYPNPFNPVTNITFDVSLNSNITIKIFNILGEEIEILTDRAYQPGQYKLSFTGNKYPSGIYFCSMIARMTDNSGVYHTETKRMALIK